ncbi:MAG: bifunctional adenosylcobinamide kinase/adenosylcobinamide-phosphate guanylyltransferase [Nodosilinea sp. WJT8-NPBG4]|nr:bifunctional adenosylcobinamide kinase/adenosylcobinamide-phosphate guanylyltransferase [Nodosilinea sp. WJT8-NPBG4]
MTINHRISLVTGPARSGKSEWAETLAANSGQSVIYIATSNVDPTDLDWQKRVELHRDRRPAHWQLQEVPVALPETILAATAQDCLLIDSLGTWLANLLEQDDDTWQATVDSLVESLRQTPSTVVLVSEETGWGVVPAYPIGRLFRDRLGTLTRRVGTVAGVVYLVVAGYAVDVKALGQEVGREC